MNTATVGLAVTPTVVSTLLSHYLKRKPLAHKPTAHLSYDEGLHLIRSFLTHASRHTVEELQAFTSQWVPHPQWVKVEEVDIPENQISRAADFLAQQLGDEGLKQVGGKEWWQWRKPETPLKAEWVEMRADYQERKKNGDPGNRVMLYVHGGAYYFGSVDEHRYQIQRHARKLKARAIAPRYRLAPQFPFPCGLQDCLATYLYLITLQEPNTIILAGDSAGAGMVLSMLVILRDRGLPLPAGAVLISPWVDLTHSFPSVAGDCPLDYIPPSGFHHKPSAAWPPPDEDELAEMKAAAVQQKKEIAASDGASDSAHIPSMPDVRDTTHRMEFDIDGERVVVKEQIQIYTTNELLTHPLVSPVLQPTLGGLPPLFIMVGGGELLRDEQIYLAHKCANPSQYLPPDFLMDDYARAQVDRYKPTDVHLQVWDDLCHVAPTLSFTRPAKYIYRSVAQFSAWALARAQKTEIDILDDDQISFISNSSSSSSNGSEQDREDQATTQDDKDTTIETKAPHTPVGSIGKAGDPLPPFKNHMIRQRVTRHGDIFPLPPASELPGCCMQRDLVGVVKVGTVRKWFYHKKKWDSRFKAVKARVHKKRLRDIQIGYEVFGEGEVPPPSALAGRRKIGGREFDKQKARSYGLSLWSLWGSKHDEMAVQREEKAEGQGRNSTATKEQGQGARAWSDLKNQDTNGSQLPPPTSSLPKGKKVKAWRKFVRDEKQVQVDENAPQGPPAADGDAGVEGGGADTRPAGPMVPALEKTSPTRELGEEEANGRPFKTGFLSPEDNQADIGVTGKRVFIGGLATPFSLKKEPETASMITLASPMDRDSFRLSTADSGSFVAGAATPSIKFPEDRGKGEASGDAHGDAGSVKSAAYFSQKKDNRDDIAKGEEDDVLTVITGELTPRMVTASATPLLTPTPGTSRPELERFVTADELPRTN
ncbi:hypothetical protein QBC35DRAFT_300716 [Podospora australis]|uniref:Alpha/beta hydrolase fold-3 domain-containing protein n=1 Tax=Podospora australis TaxID=1536484 RepID=A0AAN6WQD7_9PEZI|nr:hypothetical protein QBC35DRAFT_300716 [Podospora australis]